MTELMQASRQWASRPSDERYTSLVDMQNHFADMRMASRELVIPSRQIRAVPTSDNRGLTVVGPQGHAYMPTHWAFGQLSSLAAAPAGYLRSLPSPIAADCINYGLQFERNNKNVGFLLYKNGEAQMRAACGPNYGRVWNHDIVSGLVNRFGDGVEGDFRVPGIFGQRLATVTKENTTLFAGDQDMFVFLADEEHRIEIPNRRDGQSGSLARGFFVWNSEVGAATFGVATFLFDYVCSNRIVWGASEYREIRIRHTSAAPLRYIDELAPAIESYAHSSTAETVKVITAAQETPINDVDSFLAQRFGKRTIEGIKMEHELDEGRPIETLWDAVTGATAYARSIENQDDRVAVERIAGDILDLVA